MARATATSKQGTTPARVTTKQSSAKQNNSILSFFSKAEGPVKATSRQSRITQFTKRIERSDSKWTRPESSNPSSLFLEHKTAVRTTLNGNSAGSDGQADRARSKTPDDLWGRQWGWIGDVDEPMFKENGSTMKRRKIESSATPAEFSAKRGAARLSHESATAKPKQRKGPFIDESDSEDGMKPVTDPEWMNVSPNKQRELGGDELLSTIEVPTDESPYQPPLPPPLVRTDTSYAEESEHSSFDVMEDDQPSEGLFSQRPEEVDDHPPVRVEPEARNVHGSTTGSLSDIACKDELDASFALCPICKSSLADLTEKEVSVHVNDCLDVKPSYALTPKPKSSSNGLTRSERAAIARPGQKDPFTTTPGHGTSTFSKLMAGNAEETAWSEAAASEVASRGKQAYRRTCPFYKILPGFSICVDAFRYGAVEGCNAYFLSHFHSDHYMGLTSAWRHGPIYCSKVTANLIRQQLKVDRRWVVDIDFETKTEVPGTGGVYVTMISANHCPGSSLFLFEKTMKYGSSPRLQRVLHCGDFRACPHHVLHPLLRPEAVDPVTGNLLQQKIDVCYLDTTYLSPKYAFPNQEDVISACADLCVNLNEDEADGQLLSTTAQTNGANNFMDRFFSKVTDSVNPKSKPCSPRGRLLVVIGTYSIGKERICVRIARTLRCKIYAAPQKRRICACLEDPELSSLLTDNPLEAQIHMQTLFEMRAETLAEYLNSMKPHFSRVVGFRPTGWTYRSPAGRMIDNPPVSTVLYSNNWKTPFSARDMVPQPGSTRESACFGVPYSEHSSFRELTMFCCALRIGRVIPTVNIGSRTSRERMKAWLDRWEAEKKKRGLFQVDGNAW